MPSLQDITREALLEEPDLRDLADDPYAVSAIAALTQQAIERDPIGIGMDGVFDKIKNQVKRTARQVKAQVSRSARRVRDQIKRSSRDIRDQWRRSKQHVAIAAGVAVAIWAAPTVLPFLQKIAVATGKGVKVVGGKIVDLFRRGRSEQEATKEIIEENPEADPGVVEQAVNAGFGFLRGQVSSGAQQATQSILGQTNAASDQAVDQIRNESAQVARVLADQIRQTNEQTAALIAQKDAEMKAQIDAMTAEFQEREERAKMTTYAGIGIGAVALLGVLMTQRGRKGK